MRRLILSAFVMAFLFTPSGSAQSAFTVEQIMSAPFPENLTAARSGARLAWTFNQQGHRNIWVAEAPSFTARQLTAYDSDDGQALSELQFSSNGDALVYVRGEGKNTAGQSPNPTSNPAGIEQSVWCVAWTGGQPKNWMLGNGRKSPRRASLPTQKTTSYGLRNWTLPTNHSRLSYVGTAQTRSGRQTAQNLPLFLREATTPLSAYTISPTSR